METRVLKYFLTVAKMQNITHAAQKLHITQPTLSRQLKQLEDELGAQLLIRGKREITLTAEGRMFEHHARDILTLINQTTSEIQNFNQHELSGTINPGYVESKVSFFVDDLIADFQKQFPHVKLQTYSAIGNDIKDKIATGILDLGFVITQLKLLNTTALIFRFMNVTEFLLIKPIRLRTNQPLMLTIWETIPLFILGETFFKMN